MLGDLPFVGLGVCLTQTQGLATFLSLQGGIIIHQACVCYLPLVVCQGNPALKGVVLFATIPSIRSGMVTMLWCSTVEGCGCSMAK